MALGIIIIIIITLGVPGIIFPKARIKNHANLEFQTRYWSGNYQKFCLL